MDEIIAQLTMMDVSEMKMKFGDLVNLITTNFKNYNAGQAFIFAMNDVIAKAEQHLNGSQV